VKGLKKLLIESMRNGIGERAKSFSWHDKLVRELVGSNSLKTFTPYVKHLPSSGEKGSCFF
jgi:hypothetical protein